MTTRFPWDGKVSIALNPGKDARFALRLRIPAWAAAASEPDDIYSYAGALPGKVVLKVNGTETPFAAESGYAVVEREWTKGDAVEFVLPMEVLKVVSRPEVAANRDRIALQRGPFIYCVEGADNGGSAWNFLLPPQSVFTTRPFNVAGEPVTAIEAGVNVFGPAEGGMGIGVATKKIVAIPYYAWANRGGNQMQVWLPTKIAGVKINR
jgi:DUF1680 family protein